MLRGSGRLIVSTSICFRRVTALVLAITVLLFMPGATARGACADLVSPQSAIASPDDEIPPTQQDRGDQEGDNSRHGQCCKCPCHGLKILVSPARIGLPGHDVGSAWYPPSNDCVIESPVFKILQPPKLPV